MISKMITKMLLLTSTFIFFFIIVSTLLVAYLGVHNSEKNMRIIRFLIRSNDAKLPLNITQKKLSNRNYEPKGQSESIDEDVIPISGTGVTF